MILVDVHTGLRAAFIRNTRAGKLRQAIDIIRLDAEALLDILTHLLTPCFCAENTGLQMDLVPQAALVNRFRQIRCVGRGAAKDSRAKILHELQLTVSIAGGHRQRQAAELLTAAVESEAAGEQAVAIRDLTYILRACARGCQRTRTAVVPEVNILLRVKRDDALAGRAGGRVDADALSSGSARRPNGYASRRSALLKTAACKDRPGP